MDIKNSNLKIIEYSYVLLSENVALVYIIFIVDQLIQKI